jgi:hypothetical protein
VSRLSYWSKRLSSAQQAAVEFIPVTLSEPEASPRSVIEIEHGGVRLRVRERVDVEVVVRLCTAVVRAARAC